MRGAKRGGNNFFFFFFFFCGISVDADAVSLSDANAQLAEQNCRRGVIGECVMDVLSDDLVAFAMKSPKREPGSLSRGTGAFSSAYKLAKLCATRAVAVALCRAAGGSGSHGGSFDHPHVVFFAHADHDKRGPGYSLSPAIAASCVRRAEVEEKVRSLLRVPRRGLKRARSRSLSPSPVDRSLPAGSSSSGGRARLAS